MILIKSETGNLEETTQGSFLYFTMNNILTLLRAEATILNKKAKKILSILLFTYSLIFICCLIGNIIYLMNNPVTTLSVTISIILNLIILCILCSRYLYTQHELVIKNNIHNIIISLESIRIQEKDKIILEELKNIDFTKVREDEEKESLKLLIDSIELSETSFILRQILKRGGYSSYLFNEKKYE